MALEINFRLYTGNWNRSVGRHCSRVLLRRGFVSIERNNFATGVRGIPPKNSSSLSKYSLVGDSIRLGQTLPADGIFIGGKGKRKKKEREREERLMDGGINSWKALTAGKQINFLQEQVATFLLLL